MRTLKKKLPNATLVYKNAYRIRKKELTIIKLDGVMSKPLYKLYGAVWGLVGFAHGIDIGSGLINHSAGRILKLIAGIPLGVMYGVVFGAVGVLGGLITGAVIERAASKIGLVKPLSVMMAHVYAMKEVTKYLVKGNGSSEEWWGY